MVIPFIVAGVAIAGLIVAGCSGSEETDNPAGVPASLEPEAAPQKPQCDAFTRYAGVSQVDDRSFNAFNYIWDKNPAKANIGVWDPKTRLYLGAVSDLLRPVCEDESLRAGDVAEYLNGAVAFFNSRYGNLAKPEERSTLDESVLVLVGGLAPVSVAEKNLYGALDILVAKNQGQDDFAKVLKAGLHFNTAVKLAGVEDPYSINPKVSPKLPMEIRKAAFAELDKADKFLAEVRRNLENDPEKLDDRQIEFLTLEGAVRNLRNSLNKKTVPPKPGEKISLKRFG